MPKNKISTEFMGSDYTHIGFIGMVADGSYSHNAVSKKLVTLIPDTTGWEDIGINLCNKQVLICGAPFEIRFRMKVRNAQPKTREFVTVRYKGKLYNVLNRFKHIQHPETKQCLLPGEVTKWLMEVQKTKNKQ